jgi:putative glutamine amidotransferase
VRLSVRHTADEQSLAALVIGGGDDIGPEQYGGMSDARAKLDPARDQLEIAWIREALARDMPLLGICRGAQLINVVLGGTLHQDIRELRRHTHNRPGLLPTKQVLLTPDSRLSSICARETLRVNSLHHQAIDRPGDSLQVVARDRDNICQAVECTRGRRILGVQWHPEYLFYVLSQQRLFRWLVTQTREHAGEAS